MTAIQRDTQPDAPVPTAADESVPTKPSVSVTSPERGASRCATPDRTAASATAAATCSTTDLLNTLGMT